MMFQVSKLEVRDDKSVVRVAPDTFHALERGQQRFLVFKENAKLEEGISLTIINGSDPQQTLQKTAGFCEIITSDVLQGYWSLDELLANGIILISIQLWKPDNTTIQKKIKKKRFEAIQSKKKTYELRLNEGEIKPFTQLQLVEHDEGYITGRVEYCSVGRVIALSPTAMATHHLIGGSGLGSLTIVSLLNPPAAT